MLSVTWLSSEGIEYHLFRAEGAVMFKDGIYKAVGEFRAYSRH